MSALAAVVPEVTSDLVGGLVRDDLRAWISYPPALRRPGDQRGRLAHPLHRDRIATPATAEYLLRHAMTRPDLFPRHLPEGRGKAHQHVGVRVEAPPGAYSSIPVWRDRQHWVTITVAIATAMHPETLSSYGVAASTLQRWALAKSGYAWSNGRRCVVRPDVLASIMGVSERQAQRCNALARALGLEVVVMQGRMLTQEERWRAYDAGSRQRGLATETALTIPPDQRGLVDHVTPPRGGSVTTETKDLLGFPHGLPAGINGAATRPRPQSRRRKGSPAWRLALEVVRAVPWLAQESPHRLVGVLARYVMCPTRWSGAHIAAALTERDRRLQQPSMTATRITTRPAAVLAAALRDVDPTLDHPTLTNGPLIPVLTSCGHPSCDGHGWLHDLIEINGHSFARKCPRCPDTIRTNH